jgi:arylsulfatase A-like enzyme
MPQNYRDDLLGKPFAQSQVLWPWHDVGHMTDKDWRKARAYFYGAVALIDHAVGQVVEALEETGMIDRTMIILVGDQGTMIGEHGLYDKGPYCYDELMRIPLIIKAPEKRHREVNRQVSILDINQTMVEWMGLRPEHKNLDSRSLFPLMDRGDSGWEGPDEAFYHYEWYNGSWFGIRTIRTPHWKYCWNPADRDELYDLTNDPFEQNNLAENERYKENLEEMQKRLMAHLARTGDPLLDRFEKTIQRNEKGQIN